MKPLWILICSDVLTPVWQVVAPLLPLVRVSGAGQESTVILTYFSQYSAINWVSSFPKKLCAQSRRLHFSYRLGLPALSALLYSH